MKLFAVKCIGFLLIQAESMSAFNNVISSCTIRTANSMSSSFRQFASKQPSDVDDTAASSDGGVAAAAAADDDDNNNALAEGRLKITKFLKKRYPSFYKLLNDDMASAIKQGDVTIFVPNEEAFKTLGDKKISQIEDPRNLEIRDKMGSFHVIPDESISAVQLALEDWSKGMPKDGTRPNTIISGFNTISGEVPVGRSKSGGFLGWGAKEDGDIVIGPEAKIVQSFNVEGSFVHEVDHLISPLLLWRYCDQLRIL